MTTTAEPTFDIKSSPIQSFGALQQARSQVFLSRNALEAFRNKVGTLSSAGEEGRRRGLGFWMAGDYAKAVEALPQYTDDNVASFALARSLMTLDRPQDALPIFERLSKSYPDEPRPRAGALEARLEADLKKGDENAAVERLAHGVEHAPASFAESA